MDAERIYENKRNNVKLNKTLSKNLNFEQIHEDFGLKIETLL